MKCLASILFVLLLWLRVPRCHGYNILIFGVHPFNSHVLMMSILANELVTQGHNVTFVTVKATRPHPKLHVIRNEDVFTRPPDLFNLLGSSSPVEYQSGLFSLGLESTDNLLATDVLQRIIHASLNDTKFDAVVAETYNLGETLAAGFSQKYDCPLINYQPLVMYFNVAYMVGNPYNPAFMADSKMPFTNNMTFWQRLYNTYVSVLTTLQQNLFYLPAQDKLLRKYFPGARADQWPYISDILRSRQALTLVDAHHILTGSIALAPNILNVGGLQLKPAEPLPQDIAEFISSYADQGVIYFAMGSHINAVNLGQWRIELLTKLFATLKQGVLWKIDTPELADRLTPNVKISNWFPQNDILANPNCDLFITHGGIHSTFESLYHGVPMLILPLFADQKQNGQRAVELGYGESVDFERFDYDELLDKITRVLSEPRYKKTTLSLSAIFRSEPVHPLQKAVNAIEYVIRFKGAPHLRTLATQLSWYQLLQLDILLLVVAALYFLYTFCNFVTRLVAGLFLKPESDSEKKKKKD